MSAPATPRDRDEFGAFRADVYVRPEWTWTRRIWCSTRGASGGWASDRRRPTVSIHWSGSGQAELEQMGLKDDGDDHPEEDPAELLAEAQRWLAGRGKAPNVTPGELRVAKVAAEQMLRALNVRPSNAGGGRTQNSPARAGSAGERERGSNR